jgi:hypothetical protein
METWQIVDWTDPKAKLSKYFTVREALWLPTWGRMATTDDGLDDDAKEALWRFFNEYMDAVRSAIGKPVSVHVTFRPAKYNKEIGGAASSSHMARRDKTYGLIAACDFSADATSENLGKDCDAIRALLKPKLEALGIRMEDNGDGSTWVHVDNRAPGPSGRFFPA